MRLVLILFLFFLGCATKAPKWYQKIYNEDSHFIYATGEGKNKQEAINQALNSAVSKIQITLTSEVNIQKILTKTQKSTKTYENISQNIKAYIPDVKIYSYKIIKSEKKEKYYVLLGIDKIKNSNIIYEKSKEKIKEIDKTNINDKIFIIKNYPKYIKNLNQIISNLYFAYVMHPDEKIKNLIKRAENLKLLLKRKLQNIGFYIKNDYENIIKDSLTSLNLPIKKGIEIYQSHKTASQKILDYYIYTIYMNVILKDKRELSFNVICSGKSINGYEIAKSFALKECKRKVKEKLKTILQIHP